MKKDFFDKSLFGNVKKSLKFGKNFWSWLFVMFVFCGALFMALQPSISGEDQTYTVNFYRNDTSATFLAEMVDIYVYTGSDAPDSPVDGSGGNVTGVSKLAVLNDRISVTTTTNQSLTFYTKTTDAYNKSNYMLEINNVAQNASTTSSGYKKYNPINVNSNVDVYITGLSKNTYPLVFNNADLPGSDRNALDQMVNVYIYEGENAPDSPFDASRPDGLAQDVSPVTVTGDLLQASVTHGNLVTIYTELTPAYNKSDYVIKDSAGNELASLAPENVSYGKYGLGQITSDTNIYISGLAKNIYSLTFTSGDFNYNLSDRVELYKEDGTTLISDWSDIKLNHGDDKEIVMKSLPGYSLSSAVIKVNDADFDPASQDKDSIVLRLQSVKKDTVVTVTNVAFRKYNIYFQDEYGNSIGTDRADIKDSITQSNINENYQMIWKSLLVFRVDLKTGYDRSSITAEVDGETLTKDSGNYYAFIMSTPKDTIIKVKGITLNRYKGNFSLSNSKYNSEIKAFYKEYDSNYAQTGSTTEFYPTATSTTKDLSIPHGHDFQFYLQVLNIEQYNLDYNGEVDKNITYSSSDNNFTGIIDALAVTGVGSIVYNVNSNKTQVCITFRDVTTDINVQIKPLNEINYAINFDVPDDIKSHIKLYKGLLMDFYGTGYFKKGEQIYGQYGENFITSASGVQTESYYFVVSLFDGVLSPDSEGVQCTIESPNGSGTLNTLNTVYSSEDFSVIKVFEIKGVTSENVSVSIGGVHFSRNDVNFSIGSEGNLTATVTNYANDTVLTNNSSVSVGYGDDLRLKLVAKEGYYLDDLSKQVSVTDEENKNVSFEYASYSDHADVTISSVRKKLNVSINLDTAKMPITFNAIEGAQYYSATLESGDATFSIVETSVLKGIVTVPYGNNYYFAVKAETGYDINFVDLKKNGSPMTSVGAVDGGYLVFEIPPVTANINITGSISKATYTVHFDTGAVVTTPTTSYSSTVTYLQDGVSILGNSLTVQHGGSASFQVKLADDCDQSDLEVHSTASSSKLLPVSGTYFVTDVTKDITISVTNLTLNKYVINFTANDGAYYLVDDTSETKITSGTRSVTYGSGYSFKVEAKPGYVINSSMAVNYKTASGVSKSLIADARSGKYTISNIKENATISIENIDNIVYNITLAPIDGVTYYNDTGAVISGNLKIKYGQNFEFAVGVADAYDDSIPGMYIVVNDGLSSNVSAQKLSSGRYIIANVTQDITVKVGNITKNKYTVTLTKIEGIDYYGTSGKIITGDNEVEYKGSLVFRVRLYPAYEDSNITVKLGDNAMTSDENGIYTIPGIDENKTVTVLGIEMTQEAQLINKINALPSSVASLSDAGAVIEVSRLYNALSDDSKKSITNIAVLENLQQQVKSIHNNANGVTVDGVDWYVKLIANPISSDADACSRIYDKLSSEYILSLYDIYLWDTLNDKRYELPEGQSATITMPMPDMTYFENPTGIHESSSDGKLKFLTLTLKSTITTFSTESFSVMGIVANRSSTPGRSSLLDAVDANVAAIKEYALTTYSSSSSGSNSSGTTVINGNSPTTTTYETAEETSGNISNKFQSSNNKVTVFGSALRLILVLMILILIALSIWIIFKKRNKISTEDGK